MPVYEFRCDDYGTVSDYLLPIGDSKRQLVCTRCGSARLDRQISSPILLKTSVHVQRKTCFGRDERCQTPPYTQG